MGAQVREENLVFIAEIIDAQFNNFYSVLQNGRLINRDSSIYLFILFFPLLKDPMGKNYRKENNTTKLLDTIKEEKTSIITF